MVLAWLEMDFVRFHKEGGPPLHCTSKANWHIISSQCKPPPPLHTYTQILGPTTRSHLPTNSLLQTRRVSSTITAGTQICAQLLPLLLLLTSLLLLLLLLLLQVGYNNKDSYWVARNSWGQGFADGGYFKVWEDQCVWGGGCGCGHGLHVCTQQ